MSFQQLAPRRTKRAQEDTGIEAEKAAAASPSTGLSIAVMSGDATQGVLRDLARTKTFVLRRPTRVSVAQVAQLLRQDRLGASRFAVRSRPGSELRIPTATARLAFRHTQHKSTYSQSEQPIPLFTVEAQSGAGLRYYAKLVGDTPQSQTRASRRVAAQIRPWLQREDWRRRIALRTALPPNAEITTSFDKTCAATIVQCTTKPKKAIARDKCRALRTTTMVFSLERRCRSLFFPPQHRRRYRHNREKW